MIKAIVFDFVGVVLVRRPDYIPDSLIDSIDSRIGRVINDAQFKKETFKEFKLNEAKFSGILEKVINKYEKYKPLWELLPRLRQKYKLAIINNGTRITLPGFKKKFGYNKYFDLFVSSAIEGIRKPDREIYLLTAKRLGVEPSECLFMDDSNENVEGAKNTGMQAIWWKTPKEGFEEFENFVSNQ